MCTAGAEALGDEAREAELEETRATVARMEREHNLLKEEVSADPLHASGKSQRNPSFHTRTQSFEFLPGKVAGAVLMVRLLLLSTPDGSFTHLTVTAITATLRLVASGTFWIRRLSS